MPILDKKKPLSTQSRVNLENQPLLFSDFAHRVYDVYP